VAHGTDPAWSPTGHRLIFVSHPTRASTRLATVAAAGGSPRTLGQGVDGVTPVVSASGEIAFVRQGGLWVMHGNGTGLRQVTEGPDSAPDWSPGGRRLVFTRIAVDETGESVARVSVLDLRGGSITSIATEDAFSPNGEEWGPVWSPDGKLIAFPAPRSDSLPPPGIRLIRPDGTGERQVPVRRFITDAEVPLDWQPIVGHRRR